MWSCQLTTNGDVPAQNPVEQLTAQVLQYPDSTLLYQQLIDTLVAADQPLVAAAWCDSAANYDTKNQAAWLLLRADLQRNNGQPAEAAATYQRYLANFAAEPTIWLNLANSLAESANAEALRWCDSIDANYPQQELLAASHFIRGVYFFETKNYDQAVQWYDKAIARRYNFPEAWMEKGYSLYDAGQPEQAAAAFEKLTTLQAGNADAWYWQAKCQEAMGQKTKAIALYERALSLNSALTEATQAIKRLQ